MNKKLKKLYYDTRCGFQIIGCLLKDHSLVTDSDYQMSPDDFYADFHKGIYSSISNLIQEGVEEVTPIEIEAYLSRTSPRFYKIVFEDNDGFAWMEDALKRATIANFPHNYNRLRKLSYLRDQLDEGNSVEDVYDMEEVENSAIEEQTQSFDKMTIDELKNHFGERNSRVNSKYEGGKDTGYQKAGDNAEEIVARLKAGETYGLMGLSGYKNRMTYGCARTKFHLQSGGSGTGKSRNALGEMVNLTAVELWDEEKQCFIKNPNNPNGEHSGIYVGIELNLSMQVEIIIFSVVSGIETNKIKTLDFTEDEQIRFDYAIDVVQRSIMHLYHLPNYGSDEIRAIVKKHQSTEDVYGLFIDYLALTSGLVKEAKVYGGGMIQAQHDLFLFVSKCFKDIANDLNIYVGTSTQLNRTMDDETAEVGSNMLRGAVAITDKVDVGAIILKTRKIDLERIESILKKGWNEKKPTHVEHVFKLREGELDKVRIFRRVNLGNMQMEDMFMTDWDYKLIDFEQVYAEPYIEAENEEVIEKNVGNNERRF